MAISTVLPVQADDIAQTTKKDVQHLEIENASSDISPPVMDQDSNAGTLTKETILAYIVSVV